MRAQGFLKWIYQNYDLKTAHQIAQMTNCDGGWEGWLQVEIGRTFITQNTSNYFAREVAYPDTKNTYIAYNKKDGTAKGDIRNLSHASRADFFLERADKDQTFIELKANYLTSGSTQPEVWRRFEDDILKITAIDAVNSLINSIAVIVYWGTLQKYPGGRTHPTIEWYWTDRLKSYILDTGAEKPAVISLQKAWEADENTHNAKPRLILIASALIEDLDEEIN